VDLTNEGLWVNLLKSDRIMLSRVGVSFFSDREGEASFVVADVTACTLVTLLR